MSEQIVEVTIAPDGTVEVHVRGIEGTACLTETQQLIGALGGEVEAQTMTAEAFASTDQAEEAHDRLWQ